MRKPYSELPSYSKIILILMNHGIPKIEAELCAFEIAAAVYKREEPTNNWRKDYEDAD